MEKEIIQIGNPKLLQHSEEIDQKDILDKQTQNLVKDMIDTLNGSAGKAAGLSAVQIGILKRICICRRVDLEEETEEPIWEVMINPEIEIVDERQSLVWEGCLSIGKGEDQLWGPVYRAKKVKVIFYTTKGHKKTLLADGFLSHIVQHEVDHLNGILFLQYVSNPKNIWKNSELDKYLQKYGEFPPVD